MKIKAGTGTSSALDSYDAGREAALAAVKGLAGEPPALLFVFTTPRYDLAALLSGIRSITGAAPLVGATGSGEIVQGRYLGFGGGLGVLAMTAGSYRFGISSADHIRDNLDKAGQEIARESKAKAGSSPHAAIMLLADSYMGNLQELFQGVYRITGPKVAIIGAGAGDEQKFIRTYVFHDDQIIEEGAVALWIASDHPLHVVIRHGWQPIGIPLLVTRAAGTEIIELGGRPALVVYEEQLGLEPGTLKSENFWITSINHPFGLIQSDGSTVIRVARSITDQNSLRIQGCVPPTGSAVQVMEGSVESLLDIVQDVARSSLDPQPQAGVLLVFSCAARATIFGGRTIEESQRLQEIAGEIPVFGFHCCAEFARTSGVLGTHNASLTALAL